MGISIATFEYGGYPWMVFEAWDVLLECWRFNSLQKWEFFQSLGWGGNKQHSQSQVDQSLARSKKEKSIVNQPINKSMDIDR